MKNLIMILTTASLLVACGDDSKTNNTIQSNLTNPAVCSEILPAELAEDKGYDVDRYGYDYRRFYKKNGEFYVARENNSFDHPNGTIITCSRLSGIDTYYGYSKTCHNYKLVEGDNYYYAQNIHNSTRHSVNFTNNSSNRINININNSSILDIGSNYDDYSFFVNNVETFCAADTRYYDQFFNINNKASTRSNRSRSQRTSHRRGTDRDLRQQGKDLLDDGKELLLRKAIREITR